MYTSHFKQWDLIKTHREEEMRAIVQKRKYRKDLGKDSSFLIRGKPVKEGEVEQYFKQKKLTIEDVLILRRNQATPQAVECHTPVPMALKLPEVIAMPEAIIRDIRKYQRGPFQKCKHDFSYPDSPYLALKTLRQIDSDLYYPYQRIIHACRLFKIGKPSEAGRSLVTATRNMKRILLKEDPSTLRQLLRIILVCSRHSVPEVALATLRHFYNLGELVLGKQHLLVRIAGSMASLNTTQLVRVAAVAQEATAHDISTTLGPMHGTAFDARLLSIATGGADQDTNSAGTKLHDIWRHPAKTLGNHDYRTLDAGVYLAFDYLHSMKYQEAGRTAQEILTRARELKGSSLDVEGLRTQEIYLDALYALALSNWVLGNTTVGIEYIKDAIHQRSLTWKSSDAKTQSWQEMLKEWCAAAQKKALLSGAPFGPRRPPILREAEATYDAPTTSIPLLPSSMNW